MRLVRFCRRQQSVSDASYRQGLPLRLNFSKIESELFDLSAKNNNTGLYVKKFALFFEVKLDDIESNMFVLPVESQLSLNY